VISLKSPITIILAVCIVNAGRTSQWSTIINLRETANASRETTALHPATALSMTVMTDRHNETALFHVAGISSSPPPLLRVYGINGRMVEDLSGSVRPGSASIIRTKRALSSGLFFATLRSGSGVKTVRFIMSN
jgi:hypothetical protein